MDSALLYRLKNKEIRRKKMADKVRLKLDEYHKRFGGLLDKKVTFYCMPRRTGKTKKARHFFRNYFGHGEAILVTVLRNKEEYQDCVSFNDTGPFEATIGKNVETNKLSFIRDYGLVIIDDVHFLPKPKLIKLLNEFMFSTETRKLICFGTSANYEGEAYPSAKHLVTVADEVEHDSTSCHSCMRIGKTSFTKKIFVAYSKHDDDCLFDEDDPGYFVNRDLCFSCRGYERDEIE